jgi:hypothetical protein
VEKVKRENLKPPSVVVIGEVVKFRKRLSWFDVSSSSEHGKVNKDSTLQGQPWGTCKTPRRPL